MARIVKQNLQSDKRSKNVKNKMKRNRLCIKDKLEVLKKLDKGETCSAVSRSMEIANSTIRKIKQDEKKIKEYAACISSHVDNKVKTLQNVSMHKTETLLYSWIKDQRKKNIALSAAIIKSKAVALHNSVKSTISSNGCPQDKFIASDGWLNGFKKRFSLKNIAVTDEAASTIVDGIPEFLQHLSAIVSEGGYSLQQIFNIGATSFYWKKLPTRTNITEKGKRSALFKANKDRCTLLLGGNASGHTKIKPLLVCRSETPRALKNIEKEQLPVTWRNNTKAWITRNLFRDWFVSYFVPFIAQHNKVMNQDNKAILIMDNAPGHPLDLENAYPHIKVIFLPPNSTALLQPMDQGAISIFKAHYLRETMKTLVEQTTHKKMDVRHFWKEFNILNALEIIDKAWQSVPTESMRGIWKQLMPKCPEICKAAANFQHLVETAIRNTITLGETAGLQNLSIQDVREVIESHGEELTNEHILNLDSNLVIDDTLENIQADRNTDLSSNCKTVENTNSPSFEKLSNFLKTAEQLRSQVEEIETDISKVKTFQVVLDGLMLSYKAKNEQES